MIDQLMFLAQGTGAAIYFKTGFAPARVNIQGEAEEDSVVWTIDYEAGYGVESVDTNTTNAVLTTATGITLVKFDDEPGSMPGSGGTPSAVEPGRFWEANGIMVGASAACNVNGNPFTVQCFRMNIPIVRAVHDGTSGANTYFEDSSIDFFEAGISDNGKFILINESNDNMAYVGTITKPSGKNKYCRIYTFEDENLSVATAAADFVTNDVIFIIPRQWSQHPLITAMS